MEAVGFGASTQRANEELQRNEEEYRQQNDLAKKLGFGTADVMLELGKIFGELAQKKGTNLESIISQIRNAHLPSVNGFPPEYPIDIDRLVQKAGENIKNAPITIYKTTERTIRVTRYSAESKEYLRSTYTHSNNELFCQICGKAMPFRDRSGNPYFEQQPLFCDEHKEHVEDYIALCPTCSAKFDVYIVKPKKFEQIHQQLRISPENSDGVFAISIELDEQKEYTIKFAHSHILFLHQICTQRTHPDWFLVEYLPSYSPELNPVEQCWHYMKNVAMVNFVPMCRKQLEAKAEEAVQAINDDPMLLPAFFQHAKLKL